MRLIDIEPFETEQDVHNCQIQRWHTGDGYQDVVTTPTKDIPTVEAEPVKHGRWERVIPTKSAAKWSKKVSCSVCHKEGHTCYDYCPNCGAKMDGGADNG